MGFGRKVSFNLLPKKGKIKGKKKKKSQMLTENWSSFSYFMSSKVKVNTQNLIPNSLKTRFYFISLRYKIYYSSFLQRILALLWPVVSPRQLS